MGSSGSARPRFPHARAWLRGTRVLADLAGPQIYTQGEEGSSDETYEWAADDPRHGDRRASATIEDGLIDRRRKALDEIPEGEVPACRGAQLVANGQSGCIGGFRDEPNRFDAFIRGRNRATGVHEGNQPRAPARNSCGVDKRNKMAEQFDRGVVATPRGEPLTQILQFPLQGLGVLVNPA
jgi:hypothetical protein